MKLWSSFDLMFQRNLWDITDNQKAFVIMENSPLLGEISHGNVSRSTASAVAVSAFSSLSPFPSSYVWWQRSDRGEQKMVVKRGPQRADVPETIPGKQAVGRKSARPSCSVQQTRAERSSPPPPAPVCAVAQSCPTLCEPVDCSPPGSSAPGIFQARIPEWVATEN